VTIAEARQRVKEHHPPITSKVAGVKALCCPTDELDWQ
jgi:hypothetical protein